MLNIFREHKEAQSFAESASVAPLPIGTLRSRTGSSVEDAMIGEDLG